jgi:hypothetical protein
MSVKREFSLGSFLLVATAGGFGTVVFLSYLVPGVGAVQAALVDWAVIVGTMSLVFLGGLNVLAVHWHKIRHLEKGWVYSLFLWLGFGIMLGTGFVEGPDGELISLVFKHVQFPLQATIFSLLAFFLATAAYRAFRVRSLESLALLLVAIVVLLGQVPPSWGIDALAKTLPWAGEWIVSVMSLGGARGILLGVALGTIVVGLRLLMGIDRPYAD